MKLHQGTHLAGYTLWNEFAMDDVEKAGTQLPLLPEPGQASGMLTRTASPNSLYQGAYVLGRAGGMRLRKAKEG